MIKHSEAPESQGRILSRPDESTTHNWFRPGTLLATWEGVHEAAAVGLDGLNRVA